MKKIIYYFSLFPLQLNFFVVALFTYGAYFLLAEKYILQEEKTYFILLIEILLLFIAVFTLLILGLGLISVILSWVYFFFYSKNNPSSIQAALGHGQVGEAGNLELQVHVNGIILPFLGHAKGRILFRDDRISPAITLDKPIKSKGKLLRSGMVAGRLVWLPEIKEHQVQKIVLYFEDLFRLFSFPIIYSHEQNLLTIPQKTEVKKIAIQPDSTIDQDQRVDIPKPVKGELFNYKQFEAGDDIRRIVWKIYAKNKELIVKIPETRDPYASIIKFQPSFFGENYLSKELSQHFLNYYKTKIRQTYESLALTDFKIKFIPDQEINAHIDASEEVQDWLIQLSNSNWHQQDEYLEKIRLKKDGIYCISSMTPAEEVMSMFDNKTTDTLVLFIKLSDAFQKHALFSWRRLFIKIDEHPVNRLKQKWTFSRKRNKLIQNEKAIESYLDGQLFKHITV